MKSSAQCVLVLFSLCYHLSSSQLTLGGPASSPSDPLIPYMREVTRALRHQIPPDFYNLTVPSYTQNVFQEIYVEMHKGELHGLPNIELNGHLVYNSVGALAVLIVAEFGLLHAESQGIFRVVVRRPVLFNIKAEINDTKIVIPANIDQVRCKLSISEAYLFIGNVNSKIEGLPFGPSHIIEPILKKYGDKVDNVIYETLVPLKNLIGHTLRRMPIHEPLRKALDCIQHGQGAPS